jgi:hypothetical protein
MPIGPGLADVIYDGDKQDLSKSTNLAHMEIALQVLDELRMLDSAIDQWAIKNHKNTGDHATPNDLLAYVKQDTLLYKALQDPTGPKDALGNPFGVFIVDDIPQVNRKTYYKLSDAVRDDFWTPFIGK